MIDDAALRVALAATPLASDAEALIAATRAALAPERHGDLAHWREAIASLPATPAQTRDLSADCIRIGMADEVSTATRIDVERALRSLHPWRKGPFAIHGIHVDTEWRSDWKWRRVAPHLSPLAGRRILDVGCGNGYYALRMCGAGAALVLGVDPTLLYVAQFAALRRLAGPVPAFVLPLPFEAIKPSAAFDTVFSMGVLYHRRNPHEHLAALRDHLREGGELILETLVVEQEYGAVLEPSGRYAKMKNVFAIPAVTTAIKWLNESGFANVHCVDVTATTTHEQRRTDWMRFESLSDFLDPGAPTRTIEGLPAPRRAIFIAQSPAAHTR